MISHARLQELLCYDPENGLWTWLVNRGRVRIGDIAGRLCHDGYWQVHVEGRYYQGHRLAFFSITGEWPKDQIDHVDLDKSNNRWCNLREATNSQNQANTRKCGSNPLKGVTLFKLKSGRTKWQAQIVVRGVHIHLGLHDKAEDAHTAYMAMATRHFGEYARAQ